MANVKIVTDSNSGITQKEAEEMGISVIPMPFVINGEEFFEDINLTQPEFYEYLKSDADVHTSQPAIGSITELWDKLLADGSEIVHIPMSSGLSESCHTAETLAKDYNGRVQVVDNQRISITQRLSVLDAIKLKNEGKSAKEIKDALIASKFDSSIYISLNTLKYLKKGGRLTPAAALIGTLLGIRPVLQIQGQKLDAFKKVKTMRKAKEVMIEAIRNDLTNRFADFVKKGEMRIFVAHTDNDEEAKIFAEELKENFPDIPFLYINPLSLSVSCHIGPGSLAVAIARAL
ncbi:MAG: DegV family protein [Clostridia bacterium]|nr:DegV family protein [Clostridia bacterium]